MVETIDVIWTILTMSLLPFWALNMVVALLSMQGQKSLGFHQKHLNLCSKDELSYGFGTQLMSVSNDKVFIYKIKCIFDFHNCIIEISIFCFKIMCIVKRAIQLNIN